MLLEDLGALIGLVLALAAVGSSTSPATPSTTASAPCCIGVLLGVIAIILAIEMKSLLIGETADRHDQEPSSRHRVLTRRPPPHPPPHPAPRVMRSMWPALSRGIPRLGG